MVYGRNSCSHIYYGELATPHCDPLSEMKMEYPHGRGLQLKHQLISSRRTSTTLLSRSGTQRMMGDGLTGALKSSTIRILSKMSSRGLSPLEWIMGLILGMAIHPRGYSVRSTV